MPDLAVKGVAVRFGSVEALKDINLKVEAGSFVTLLGPSGCGKTTLLNVISGFLKPTQGHIEIDGENVTEMPPEKRNTAMCFQSYALFPHLSVFGNVAFGPRQAKKSNQDTQKQVDDLLGQMGLDLHKDKLPNALSGGQQQRVALARALAVEPGLVLFDEPLSNLDAKLRDQVRTEIRALQRRVGFTAVYVTHDQAEALAMSDTVFLLNKGVIEQSGTPRDIYFAPRTPFVADFIGAANIHSGIIQGGKMQTPFGSLHKPTLQDGPAIVCWRPEAMTLGGPLSGTVTSSAFQGGHLDVFVTAGDETVRLQVSGSEQIENGQTVQFDVKGENIVQLEDAANA
jgi:ABC-type Fe3+/spermidine/putrescine transport system ATPase subunit